MNQPIQRRPTKTNRYGNEKVEGELTPLVNFTGHGPRAPILDITDEDWHLGMEVYFLSAVRTIRLVAPIMAAQGGGSIVNISTTWAFEPSEVFPTSTVFRAGLTSFTKIFADRDRRTKRERTYGALW